MTLGERGAEWGQAALSELHAALAEERRRLQASSMPAEHGVSLTEVQRREALTQVERAEETISSLGDTLREWRQLTDVFAADFEQDAADTLLAKLDEAEAQFGRPSMSGSSRLVGSTRMKTRNERWPRLRPRDILARMVNAKDILGRALGLPQEERAELANALLDSLEGPNVYEELTPEQFRTEMARRAEECVANPDDGEHWQTIRDELSRE